MSELLTGVRLLDWPLDEAVYLDTAQLFATTIYDSLADTGLCLRKSLAGETFVITEEERLLGAVVVQHEAGSSHIPQISVEPGRTRHNYGAALMHVAALSAAKHNSPEINLVALRKSRPFFGRLGFSGNGYWFTATPDEVIRKTSDILRRLDTN